MKQHFETTFQKILHPKVWRKLPWERIWAPESGNFVTFIVTFRQDKTRQDKINWELFIAMKLLFGWDTCLKFNLSVKNYAELNYQLLMIYKKSSRLSTFTFPHLLKTQSSQREGKH